MKKIKFHQLQQSNRLIIQSIRLELNSQQSRSKKRGRFITMPDQHSQQIFRSKRKKHQLSSIRLLEPHYQNYSIPLKLNKWQAIEQQEMKQIKSNIKEKKQKKSIDLSLQQPQNNKEVVKIGSLIFVKEMFPDTSSKNSRQKRRITNLLKFKNFKSINPLKIRKSKQYLADKLTVNPMKISIDLPKLRLKDTDALRDVQKNDLQIHLKQAQRSLLLKKADIRKFKKVKPNDLSPWSTKGQIFNQSVPAHDILS